MNRWRAVLNGIRRATRGKLKHSDHVLEHNAPTYQQVYTHFNNAFNRDRTNFTDGGTRLHWVRAYFVVHPNKRQNITAAYNKLNNMARELAMVRQKAVAASTLQKHWRSARPAIMNKRKVTALRAMSTLPGVPNTRRAAFEKAFPKPVYGPKTSLQTMRSYKKYNSY